MSDHPDDSMGGTERILSRLEFYPDLSHWSRSAQEISKSYAEAVLDIYLSCRRDFDQAAQERERYNKALSLPGQHPFWRWLQERILHRRLPWLSVIPPPTPKFFPLEEVYFIIISHLERTLEWLEIEKEHAPSSKGGQIGKIRSVIELLKNERSKIPAKQQRDRVMRRKLR